MVDIERCTCIRFIPRKKQKDYIYIKSEKGCVSNLGKIGGRQVVSLESDGCVDRGTIIHGLVHAIGFDHMQSRSDRDNFVEIVWKNIKKSERHT